MLNPTGKAKKAMIHGFADAFKINKPKNPFQYAPRKLMYLASWWDKGYSEGLKELKTLEEIKNQAG